MNEIKIFENVEFGSVRTTIVDDEPWFVGKDVAEILGYSNSRDALSKRVDDEDKIDGVAICDSIGRQQKPILINESGLYSLILSSKLPKAKKFKRWVTSEVLPQIRKTGGYIPVQEADDDITILSKAILIADKTMKEKDAIIAKQTEVLSITEPKAEFYDRFMNSDGYASFNVVAKELGVGRNKLMAKLREKKILFNDGNSVIAYQPYVNNGYFIVKHCFTPYGIHCATTKVTPRGMEFLHRFVKKNMQEVAR